MEIENTCTPLVSVLIPAYNHENYVQEAIKSIISQTYENIELLVVNDGSVDSTWQKICEMELECKKRFVRVVFWTQKNLGVCMTLNELVDNARGDYIYLIASDDKAFPFSIEKEVDFLDENPDYALCVGDNELIDFVGKKCYWNKKQNIIYEKEKCEYSTVGDYLQRTRGFDFSSAKFGTYEELFKINHIPNGYLIRRKVFDNFRYTKKAPLEDWNLMLHIAKYYKMKYFSEILFMYRWHSANTVKKHTRMLMLETATRQYETKLISKIDLCSVLPDVAEFIKTRIGTSAVTTKNKRFLSAIFERIKLLIYSFVFLLAYIFCLDFFCGNKIVEKILDKIIILEKIKKIKLTDANEF